MAKRVESVSLSTLRNLALQYPEVEEGIACAGTPIEKRTIKVGKKAFVFLDATSAMVKLSASLPEAVRLAAKAADVYKPGAHGWVTVKSGNDGTVPLDLLERWIGESYGLFAPKKRVPAPAGNPRRRNAKVAKNKRGSTKA